MKWQTISGLALHMGLLAYVGIAATGGKNSTPNSEPQSRPIQQIASKPSKPLPMAGILIAPKTTAESLSTDWRVLSALQDPPGMPSPRAARVATAHLSEAEIQAKLNKLSNLYNRASSQINGTAAQILKREILLLQIALEN